MVVFLPDGNDGRVGFAQGVERASPLLTLDPPPVVARFIASCPSRHARFRPDGEKVPLGYDGPSDAPSCCFSQAEVQAPGAVRVLTFCPSVVTIAPLRRGVVIFVFLWNGTLSWMGSPRQNGPHPSFFSFPFLS